MARSYGSRDLSHCLLLHANLALVDGLVLEPMLAMLQLDYPVAMVVLVVDLPLGAHVLEEYWRAKTLRFEVFANLLLDQRRDDDEQTD